MIFEITRSAVLPPPGLSALQLVPIQRGSMAMKTTCALPNLTTGRPKHAQGSACKQTRKSYLLCDSKWRTAGAALRTVHYTYAACSTIPSCCPSVGVGEQRRAESHLTRLNEHMLAFSLAPCSPTRNANTPPATQQMHPLLHRRPGSKAHTAPTTSLPSCGRSLARGVRRTRACCVQNGPGSWCVHACVRGRWQQKEKRFPLVLSRAAGKEGADAGAGVLRSLTLG